MIRPGDEDQDAPLDTGAQLSLTGDDDALPWLATDDEDEEETGGGTDYRILAFAVLALVVLAGLLFGVRAFFAGSEESTLVADGSTIEAPDTPYRERPADPGGQDVPGTGDLSYEVGEGVTREGQIASGGVPAPSVDLAQPPRAPAAGTGATPAPAATSGGVGVQVGAFQTRESAEAGWTNLTGRFEVLQGVSHRVVEGRADSGTIYRLQAVAANVAQAEALCRSIRNAGGDCQVRR